MSKLELYNIYAGYEESKPVLKDISFFVEKGEFIVLLGTSGCGKTTILNLIAGMIPISAGELYIDGVKSNDTPPRKRNIAMVFQNYSVIISTTSSLLGIFIASFAGFGYEFHRSKLSELFFTVTVLSIIGCAFSLIFTTGISSYLVGIVDGFITEFCILLLIVIQSIIFTWFYDIEGLIPVLNENDKVKVGKLWVIVLKYILPVFLLIMWIFGFYDIILNSNGFELTVFAIIGVAILILSYVFTNVNK